MNIIVQFSFACVCVTGAQVSGMPGVAHGLFPRGGIELVSFFYQACNEQLAEQLAEQKAAEQQEGAL